MSEHREKAVEAAMSRSGRSHVPPGTTGALMAEEAFRADLQAAEPHLQRMYWEGFREAPNNLLKAWRGKVDSLNESAGAQYARGQSNQVLAELAQNLKKRADELQAALAKAQELMEGESEEGVRITPGDTRSGWDERRSGYSLEDYEADQRARKGDDSDA